MGGGGVAVCQGKAFMVPQEEESSVSGTIGTRINYRSRVIDTVVRRFRAASSCDLQGKAMCLLEQLRPAPCLLVSTYRGT